MKEVHKKDIYQDRWDINALNIPRTKKLIKYFLASKQENDELLEEIEEEQENDEREKWLLSF